MGFRLQPTPLAPIEPNHAKPIVPYHGAAFTANATDLMVHL
jgi:hypothetical protein